MNDEGADAPPSRMTFDRMLASRSEVADVDTLRARASGIEDWGHVIGRAPTIARTLKQEDVDRRCAFDADEYMEWAQSLDYPDTGRPDGAACAEIADRMYGACRQRRDNGATSPMIRDHPHRVTFPGGINALYLPVMWASASMCKQGLTGTAAAYSVILASDRRMEDMAYMEYMDDDDMVSEGEREGSRRIINVRRSPLAFTSVLMAMLGNGEALPMTFMMEEILAMGPTVIRHPHAGMLIESKRGGWDPMRALWSILHSVLLTRETCGEWYYVEVMMIMDGNRRDQA